MRQVVGHLLQWHGKSRARKNYKQGFCEAEMLLIMRYTLYTYFRSYDTMLVLQHQANFYTQGLYNCVLHLYTSPYA